MLKYQLLTFVFQELPEHEKEVYQEMARQDKANKRYQPARNDRMDCTGEYISVSFFFFTKEGILIECHKAKPTVHVRVRNCDQYSRICDLTLFLCD